MLSIQQLHFVEMTKVLQIKIDPFPKACVENVRLIPMEVEGQVNVPILHQNHAKVRVHAAINYFVVLMAVAHTVRSAAHDFELNLRFSELHDSLKLKQRFIVNV